MRTWVIAAIAVVAVAGSVAAEDSEELVTTPATDAKLLDDDPNLGAAFEDQWRNQDVPKGYEDFPNTTEYFGRLRDSNELVPLSLQECIRLALANNANLQVQRLGPLNARSQVLSAQAIFDPAFVGETNYDREAVPSSNALSGAVINKANGLEVNGGLQKTLLSGGLFSLQWVNSRTKTNGFFDGLVPKYTTGFVASLNQPLLRNFGWRFSTLLVRIAQTGESSAVYQYESTVSDTVKNVETAYWALVLATETIRVQTQGLALARELERQNEGKFRVGTLPQTAVLEARADVARREANLIRVQNAQSNSRDALRALINVAAKDSHTLLMVDAADRPPITRTVFNLDESLGLALEERAELQAAKLTVQANAMQLKVNENQLLPNLNLVASIGTNGLGGVAVPRQRILSDGSNSTVTINPFHGDYGDTLERAVDGRYYSYAAGVQVEIPLTNAQARADFAQARIQLEQSQRNLQLLQQQVTFEVKKAVNDLVSDIKSIEATRIARELAEENLRNQKARYDVGLVTTKDLLDFQDRLTQAEVEELSALVTYNNDLAELRRSEGTLLAASNIVVQGDDELKTPWWAEF